MPFLLLAGKDAIEQSALHSRVGVTWRKWFSEAWCPQGCWERWVKNICDGLCKNGVFFSLTLAALVLLISLWTKPTKLLQCSPLLLCFLVFALKQLSLADLKIPCLSLTYLGTVLFYLILDSAFPFEDLGAVTFGFPPLTNPTLILQIMHSALSDKIDNDLNCSKWDYMTSHFCEQTNL